MNSALTLFPSFHRFAIRSILVSVLFVLCLQPVFSASPLAIDDSLTSSPLGPHIEYFFDTGGKLTIEKISSPEFASHFKSTTSRYLSFGYSRHPLWLKFTTVNNSNKIIKWFLQFNYPIIDAVHLFVPSGDNYITFSGGDRMPFDMRPVNHRTIVFPIIEHPGRRTFYLKIYSQGSIITPLTAHSESNFDAQCKIEYIVLWMYYGIMLALTLYNFFIFLSVRDNSYLHLVFVTVIVSLYSMVHNGLAFQYLWPRSLWWTNISHPFFLMLFGLLAILFTRSFLNTKIKFKRTDSFLLILFAVGTLFSITPFFIEYYYVTQLSTLISIVTACTLVGTGIITMIGGSRQAPYYLLAWTFFLVTGSVSIIRAHGIVINDFVAMWGYQIGSSLIVLIFSMGISDKINLMRLEKENALTALREADERYRVLVENALEGILLIINEKAVYANNALITMSGYNEKDFYALDILNDFFPDNEKGKPLVQKNYYDRISGSQKSSQYEAQILRKDGTTQDVIISASSILIQGEPGSLCIITNISQLKEAQHTITRQFNEIERQYRELESLNSELISVQSELIDAHEKTSRQMQQLEATLRSIGDAVITTDTDGNILMINEETERITQLSSSDVRGRPFSETISLYLQSSQTPVDPVDQILQTGRFSHSATPLVLRRKDGTERTVEIRGTRILLENNTLFGAVMAIRDVTEKHKLEQEILKMSKIESIGVLAGGIAHDFNNLLTAVIGNTALARNNAGNEEKLIKYLSMIEGAAKRAVALTQQLLTFSKGGSPRKQVTSITALLRECAEFILMGSNIKPVFEFEDNIWPVQIDVNQMSHVFNNILINAKHAMSDGGTIMITAHNIPTPPEDIPLFQRSHVRISIGDQGPGIPDENLSRIFDPYFTTKVQGSGLGLASSYSIIKKHKGHIVATSESGKGATFTIYLQASDAPLPDETVPEQPPGTGRGNILLMDDEEYILETTGEMLRDLGYNVTTAADGAAAITLYREALKSDNPFDIVIMDLTIPGGMGGKEALTELLAIHPEVKAIVSSGYSDEIILSNYNDYGFIDYLSKPYTFQDIAKILKTHLSAEKKS